MTVYRNMIVSLLAGCCWVTVGDCASDPASSVLWYERPARTWMTEALPLGGGSLGGMFFGLTETERVQFNHNTLWTGDENDTGRYQAFGDIFIRLGHHNPSGYRRELDIDTATLKVTYTANDVHYERIAYVSHPAGVLVYRFSADKPGAYTGRIWLTDMHNAPIQGDRNHLTASGQLGSDGLFYEARLQVLHQGGLVRIDRSDAGSDALAGVPEVDGWKLPHTALVFEGCDAITLVLAADTDYRADPHVRWRGDHPRDTVSRRLAAANTDCLTRRASPRTDVYSRTSANRRRIRIWRNCW